jgi:hypothetical protein
MRVRGRGRRGDAITSPEAPMSYLFCAFVYDRKSFDPGAIVETFNENFTPEDEYDALVKVPVKGSIDAVFMLPLRKGGLKTEAYFDWLEFLAEDYIMMLDEAISAGRGVVDPRVKPVVYVVGYCDMSPHNVLWKISPDGVDYRSVIQDEGYHIFMPAGGEPVEQREDISVDAADFGATEESDATFREDEYHAEVERKERPFSPAAVLKDELRLKSKHLLDAIERLEQGEKIWPPVKKAAVKKAAVKKAAAKKAPARKTKSKTPAKKGAKAKATRK